MTFVMGVVRKCKECVDEAALKPHSCYSKNWVNGIRSLRLSAWCHLSALSFRSHPSRVGSRGRLFLSSYCTCVYIVVLNFKGYYQPTTNTIGAPFSDIVIVNCGCIELEVGRLDAINIMWLGSLWQNTTVMSLHVIQCWYTIHCLFLSR